MAPLLQMMYRVMATMPQALLNPWSALLLLVATLLVFAQYRRIAGMEVELYGIPKHRPLQQTCQSLLIGSLGGLMGSIIAGVAGVGLTETPGTTSAFLYLWPVSLLLGAFNPRLFCFAYSSMLVALSRLVFGWPHVNVASVLAMVAVFHMVEAFLVWMSGAAGATPLLMDGPQGEAEPGFMLQRFWPVPIILPFFTAVGGGPLAMPAWWPLLRFDPRLLQASAAPGWHLLPAVVTMGYSDLAIAAPPEVRTWKAGRFLLLYSAVLMALAVAGGHWSPLLWVGALFSGFGHEAMAVWSGRWQMAEAPYLRRPNKGVGVLDVLPGTLAAEGGLRSGAVILSVGDYEVHSREQLHEALLASPAYVQIMFRVGRQLESCRLPRPAEGLLGLGAILLPEPGDKALSRMLRPAFFRWSGPEQ